MDRIYSTQVMAAGGGGGEVDGTIGLLLALVALLIALTAFFVGSEFAVVKVRMSRLDQLIAEGNNRRSSRKKLRLNSTTICRPVSSGLRDGNRTWFPR